MSSAAPAARTHPPMLSVRTGSTKRARSSGHPYTPGMFDALIDRPVLDHHDPAQIRAVSVELAASGRSVVVGEVLRSGPGQRHLTDLAEPYSIFMRLADGREVWIEVRVVDPVAGEDVEPWLMVGQTAVQTATTIAAEPAIQAPELVLRPAAFSCLDFLPE